MDTGESPLDVLTRAATMVQNNILPPSYEETRLCREEAGGGKWRRSRATRKQPPNYTARESPIDLSTRKLRGSPPSYLQTMQAKQAASAINRIECGGVCDPMIDEHFRRSLGNDYLSNSSSDGDKSDTSLSVDDHFAKALGDTWVKLQKEEMERERRGSVGQEPAGEVEESGEGKDRHIVRHNQAVTT